MATGTQFSANCPSGVYSCTAIFLPRPQDAQVRLAHEAAHKGGIGPEKDSGGARSANAACGLTAASALEQKPDRWALSRRIQVLLHDSNFLRHASFFSTDGDVNLKPRDKLELVPLKN
jgi:hypothetical protein